jgi:acetyl esterase/lipase
MCPSNLLSLTDVFIEAPYLCQLTSLTIDINKYYKKEVTIDQRYDFTKCDKQIVQNFPNTFLIVASNDIIKDECYRLADFLVSNNVSLKIKEFLYYSHGFMNMTALDSFYVPGLDCAKDYVRGIFK